MQLMIIIMYTSLITVFTMPTPTSSILHLRLPFHMLLGIFMSILSALRLRIETSALALELILVRFRQFVCLVLFFVRQSPLTFLPS